MNQFQKAIHKIREYSNLGFYSKERSNLAERHFIEYKEDLQKLVDKATPKKPIYDYERNECQCHNCKQVFGYAEEDDEVYLEKINNCFNCGQAIDWSEDETK